MPKGKSVELHSGHLLEVLLSNQVCKQVEPKMWLHGWIRIGISGGGMVEGFSVP